MELKLMTKKCLGVLVSTLGLAILAPRTSQADFSSLNRSTSTAVAALTGTGSVSFSISIHKVSDNSSDTAVNWIGVSLPAGFVRANDYIQLNSVVSASGGGIQIYTDNTAADAAPAFTGVPTTTDPSGLVDTSNSVLRLPMAWSVKESTSSAPVATDPNNNPTVDLNAPQWVFFKDRATQDIPAQNTKHFTNGEQFVEVIDGALGLHATQVGFFPGSFPVTYIYPEANFGLAVTPRTYKTSTLRLESFTQ